MSPDQATFEGRVVVVCEKMMSQPCWTSSNQLIHSKNSRGMTLLHLAAAQGYAGLIQTLIRWRWVIQNTTVRHIKAGNCFSHFTFVVLLCSTKHADSIDLELEVDPLNVDHFSCTPLVRKESLKATRFHVAVLVTCLLLSPADVGVCAGPRGGSTRAVPVGPKSSGHSWFFGTPATEHRPIQGPHSISGAFGAAATESSSPANGFLDGKMEGRNTDRRKKQ